MGGAVFPPYYLTWGQTMEVMKMTPPPSEGPRHTLPHSVPPTLQQATANPHLLQRPPDTQGKSGPVSCGVTAPFSWVLVYRVLFVPPRICSPVLCKFWRLYGGINGNLLQEGLGHTQVCCSQSPCLCRSPLLTRPSSGDTHTQLCLSLCGVSGSWCAQAMLETSEHLWKAWGLILNVKVTICLQL